MSNEVFRTVIEREILPFVQTPGRYTGNEENVIVKDWSPDKISVVLIYPDAYELGMSYTGFQILYHILNKRDNLVAERAYAPWPDMEEKIREKNIPLFSLETRHSLRDFDFLGFTLPYEMDYTNILNILDLGKIPIESSARKSSDPVVIAGGLGSFNPEPLHRFIDLFVLGDSEEIIAPLIEFMGKFRKSGLDRTEILLKTIREFPGIYVPQFYKEKNGRILPVSGIKVPQSIKAIKIPELQKQNYPDKPLIPLIDIPHNRFAIEVMRGCPHGCRFCNAGFLYRPLRERSPEDVLEASKEVIRNSGQDEISFLSLSTSDYSNLLPVVNELQSFVKENRISLSLPSLRADQFDDHLAEIAGTGRFSGLTFAPEAGTKRLRDAINKNLEEEELFNAVRTALSRGWKSIKLYFMVGLPTETEEDLQGIAEIVKKLLSMKKEFGRFDLHITLSTFIPKAHTPFQWEKQLPPDEIEKRIQFIVRQLPRKHVKINWRDPQFSLFEGILARGGRETSELIKYAWENGARMDAWQEFFNKEAWQTALSETKLNPENVIGYIPEEKPLPWEHIDTGIPGEFLKEERKKAYSAETSIGCTERCLKCGICDFKKMKILLFRKHTIEQNKKKLTEHSSSNSIKTSIRYRIKYEKNGLAKYTSHLDTQRIWQRALRRSGLPIQYSKGYHPKPKISLGLPLPLGYTSSCEYIDIWVNSELEQPEQLIETRLPSGFRILQCRRIENKAPSIQASASSVDYSLAIFDPDFSYDKFLSRIKKGSVYIEKVRRKKSELIRADEFIQDIYNEGNLVKMKLKIENGRTIRPDSLLTAFCKHPIYFECNRDKIHFRRAKIMKKQNISPVNRKI